MTLDTFTNLKSVTTGGDHAYFTGTRDITESENGIRVGDTVTWESFTDHRGNFHPAISGLRVESVTAHTNKYTQYERIAASGSGYRFVEGNAKFFRKVAQ